MTLPFSILPHRRLSSLQARLLLILLLVLAPTVGQILSATLGERREAIHRAQRDAMHTAHALVVAHDRWIAAARDLLLVLAQLPAVRQGDAAACNALLPPLFQTFERYTGGGVAMPDGTVVCASLPLPGPLNIADQLHVQRALQTQQFAVGAYRIGPVSQKPILSLALPVLEEAQGTVQAVVTAALDLGWVHEFMRTQSLPPDATMTLLDRRGTILARFPEAASWVGKAIPEGPLRTATLAAQGPGTVEAAGLDGVVRFYAFVPLRAQPGSTDGYLYVGIPRAVIVAPAERTFRWHLLTLSGVAVVALGIAWVTAERLVRRPAQALVHATQQLGAGDLSVRSGPPYPAGELGQLARAFDDMAATLSLRQAAATQAEEALARHAERLRILHEIDRALLVKEAPETIAGAVIGPLRALLGVPRAIVNLFDLAAHEVEWLAAAGRHRVHRGPGVRYSLRLMGDVDALRRGEVQVIDTHALPPGPAVEALLASGVEVYMVVPMLAAGELIGALSFGGASASFPDEQVSIAREAAAQLAIVITHARLYERIKRQAEELELRVHERTQELHTAHAALVAAKERAEASDRLKSEFLAHVSHELRTPLHVILSFADFGLEKVGTTPPEKLRDYFARIDQSGKLLLTLVNDLLDLAKLEAGKMSFEFAPTDLSVLLSAVADECMSLAAARHLTVHLLPPVGTTAVRLDATKIMQVLRNLLSNAVKFSPDGGTIELGTSYSERTVVVCVRDQGVGIPEEELTTIFEKFVQSSTTKTGAGGTGLGLSICREIIAAHQGRIWAENALDGGAVFSFALPLPTPDEAGAAPALVGVPGDIRQGSAYARAQNSHCRR